ncbi:hypothetical protein HYC85_016376, partial [Camellia sinensis]
QLNIILSENIELCLFVKFSDLGIGEVSGTHPPASSRLCFQVTKRRRTEERGLGQQDYTRRIISSPYMNVLNIPATSINVLNTPVNFRRLPGDVEQVSGDRLTEVRRHAVKEMEESPSSTVWGGKITGIKFGLATCQEICTSSNSDFPISHASQLSNPFLGLPLESGKCESCGAAEPGTCEGHFGYIELPIPVYHPSHVSELKRLLSLVCFKCLKLRSGKFQVKNIGILERALTSCSLLLWVEMVLRVEFRSSKEAAQISIHEAKTDDGACYLELKLPSKSRYRDGCWNFLERYGYRYGDNYCRPLLASEVMIILKKLPSETKKKLAGKGYFPQDGYILQYLPVPPNCLSVPDVSDGITVMSSDLSITMLKKILKQVEIIKSSRSGTPNFESHEVEANDLQAAVAQYLQVRGTAKSNLWQLNCANVHEQLLFSLSFRAYFFYKASRDMDTRFGINKEQNDSTTKAWLEKMKTLFIRKGCGFSSRSVITGDAYKGVNEIGLPFEIAQRITFEERVTQYNMQYLQKLVDEKLCLTYRDGLSTYSLREGSKGHTFLRPGQVVHRRIMDGDIVFINRPPTTHKHSLQALSVYVHDDHTVKINPLICGPLSADFDGDCVHIFYPQSLAAKSEVLELFSVEKQLLSSHSGNLNLQLATDSLLSLKILFKDYFLDRAAAQQLAMFVSNSLPQPALLKTYTSGPHWTALQILQTALPRCFDCSGERHLVCKSEILSIDFSRDVMQSIINDIVSSICFEKGPDELRLTYNELVELQLENHLRLLKVPVANFILKSVTNGSLVGEMASLFQNKHPFRAKYPSEEYGLVTNCLFHGLDPYQEMVHSISAREVIVRSSRGLTEPGTLFKNLMAILRDVVICYDDTVRNVCSNSVIQFDYGVKPGSKSAFAAGEPVGVLAATAMSNPAYKAVLDSSPSSNNSWEMMKEILLCAVNFKNVLSDRRVILYLNDCDCGRKYCRENAAYLVKNQLKKVSLKDIAVEFLIEFNGQQTMHGSSEFDANLLGHVHLNKELFQDLNISMQEVCEKCQETIDRVRKKKKKVGYLLKRMKLSARILTIDNLVRCGHILVNWCSERGVGGSLEMGWGLGSEASLQGLGFGSFVPNVVAMVAAESACFPESCSFYILFKVVVVLRMEVVVVALSRSEMAIDREGKVISSGGFGELNVEVLTLLRDWVVVWWNFALVMVAMNGGAWHCGNRNRGDGGDPRVCMANIIWISPDTTTWIRNPSKSQKGELALEVVLEKEAVKQSGDAWRTVLDSCLPVIHLIDTNRSIPHAIKQVQELLGISCAFEQAVQRLSTSVSMVAKGVLKEHLILLASSMTCAGNLIGFNSGGIKALSRSLNVQIPFTEATLFTPRKCFERAAEKCHVDSLSSIVASCSWGKQVAVGTGSRFDVLWDTREVGMNQQDGIDVYNFLHLVRSSSKEAETNSACLGAEIDYIELDSEMVDWDLSPEHSSGKPVFEDSSDFPDDLDNNQVVDGGWPSESKWEKVSSENTKSSGKEWDVGKRDNWGPGPTMSKPTGWSNWGAETVQSEDVEQVTQSKTSVAWGSSSTEESKGHENESPANIWSSNKNNESNGSKGWAVEKKQNLGEDTMSKANGWGSSRGGWGGNAVQTNDVPSSTAQKTETQSKASLTWGSSNSDALGQEFQSPSGRKKESPFNSWKSSQIDDSGKGWGVDRETSSKSSGWSTWGTNKVEIDEVPKIKAQETEWAAPSKTSLDWGSPSGKQKESPFNSWKSSQNDDRHDVKEWGVEKKQNLGAEKTISKASGWSSQNDDCSSGKEWVLDKKQNLGAEKEASGWSGWGANTAQTEDKLSTRPQEAEQLSQSKTSVAWGSGDEGPGTVELQSQTGQQKESAGNVWSPSQNGTNEQSNQSTSINGWDSANSGGTNASEKVQWGQARRFPAKREQNTGEWRNKASANFTATRQRLDMFTSEEQDILLDVEPIMQSIRRIMHQTGYNDGDPLSAEDQSYVLDNVFGHHPDKAAKMGAGIDYVMVCKHSSFQESRCFYIVSTDGNKVDFSYRKCLENFIKGKYPDKAEAFNGKYFKKPQPRPASGSGPGWKRERSVAPEEASGSENRHRERSVAPEEASGSENRDVERSVAAEAAGSENKQ